MAGPRIIIVVLGDVGRSPRMQYHAESCLALGWDVELVGYRESPLIPPLLEAEQRGRLRFHVVKSPRRIPRRIFAWLAPARAVSQSVVLLYTLLFRCGRTDWLLVQTPPAIPTLAIAHLSRWLRGLKLLIDWHNTSSSLLLLKQLGRAARIAGFYERSLARLAARHLTVTAAFGRMLKEQWGVVAPIDVLYDRPTDRFGRLGVEQVHSFVSRLVLPSPANPDARPEPPLTLPGPARFSPVRNAWLVSSSSWTEDEDFGVLLSALERYDQQVEDNPSLPDVSVFLTGRGPMLARYLEACSTLSLRHVVIRSLWLEPVDYPLLLGCCDIGVSLHKSSSGLDLPMKIADMFGSLLPVITLGYPTLRSEGVADGRNGLIVTNAEELAGALVRLLENWSPADPFDGRTPLGLMRASLRAEFGDGENRWKKEWNRVVAPILRGFQTKAVQDKAES